MSKQSNAQFKMGWLNSPPDYRDYQLAAIEPPMDGTPSVVDMRADAPYDDQDGIGACTADAAEGLVRFIDRKQGGSNEEYSRLFNYFESRKRGGLYPLDIGAYNRDAVATTVSLGSALERDWPYVPSRFNETPPQIAYDNAQQHQTLAYFAVGQSQEALEGCLAAGFPFLTGSTLYQNFYMAASTGMVPMPSGPAIGGHCLMYCGYDRIRRLYIARGSWGPWGDSGYIYMPYDYLHNGNLSADFWTIRQVEEGLVPPDPNAVPVIKNVFPKGGINKKWKVKGKNFHEDAKLFVDGSDTGAVEDDGVFTFKRVFISGQHNATVKNPQAISEPFVFVVD